MGEQSQEVVAGEAVASAAATEVEGYRSLEKSRTSLTLSAPASSREGVRQHRLLPPVRAASTPGYLTRVGGEA